MDQIELEERSGIYLFILPKWRMCYVGRTNNLKRRYMQHVFIGSHKKEIKDYLKKYKEIEFMILEYTEGYKPKDQALIEKQWIEHYKRKNVKLLNVNDPTLEDVGKEPIPVLQYTLEGQFVAEHVGINEAARSVGAKGGGNLIGTLKNQKPRGKRFHAITRYGYLWFYKESFTEEKLKEKILLSEKSSNKRDYASKEVFQFSLSGEFIKEYKSAVEASNIVRSTALSSTVSGRIKSAGGFIWIYKKEFSEDVLRSKVISAQMKEGKKIIQLDKKTGEIIKVWRSSVEAATYYKCTREAINVVCRQPWKSSNGYKWKFYEESELNNGNLRLQNL